jgi:hypothetical protein
MAGPWGERGSNLDRTAPSPGYQSELLERMGVIP